MMSWQMDFWHWWVLALVLIIVEMLASGFFFLWLAVAGLVTGCVVWLMPTSANSTQYLLFSALAVASIFAWRRLVKTSSIKSDHPLLNKRGAQYVGRVFNLYEAIENGQGKIKVDDTIWKVHGEDCVVNTKVKVTAIRGTVFEVQRVPE